MNDELKNALSVLDLNYLKQVEDYAFTRSDGRKINIVRVEPINFNLKTKSEQMNILQSYKLFLKQCKFNFQIYVQTQKVDIQKHINEIKKCEEFEVEISDMAKDYIELIKEIVDSKSSISRKFYIVYEADEDDSKNVILEEGLKLCGNMVHRCDKNEILKLFKSCFKKQQSNLVAL